MSTCWAGKALNPIPRWAFEVNVRIIRRTFGKGVALRYPPCPAMRNNARRCPDYSARRNVG